MAGSKITAVQDLGKAIDVLNGKLIISDKNLISISKNIRKASKGFAGIKTPTQVNKKLEKTKVLTEQLSVALKEQKALELNLIKTIEKKKLAVEGTNKALVKERFELQQINQKVKEAAVLSSKLSTEYQKQTIKLNQLIRKRQDLALKQELGIKLSKRETVELKKLTAQITRKDRALKKVDAQVGRSFRHIGDYKRSLLGAAGAARSLASAMGLVGGAFLFVSIMRDAIKTVRNFEKQNATLSGILQVEKKDMIGLIDESKRLGEITVKSAEEVVGLQIAYARLGFEQQEIIDLTEATIQGSIAMNSELDETANLVGAVVNTFDDLSTTDAPKIIDIMSLATAKSALNFEKLQKGIPIVSGAANAAGIPFTKLIALMGKLADSGIDVSTSSTSIRNIFIEAAGQGLNYEEILQKIKGSTDKLTASYDEFGKRAAVSAAVLSSNIDATKELDEALQGAAGTADRMAKKELDTLDGAIKLLQSAWKGLILDTDDANSVSNKLKTTIQFLTDNLKNIINTIIISSKVWIAYKVAVLLAGAQSRLTAIKIGESAIASNAAASGVKRLTLSWKAFNRALKANALFLIIAGITTAIALFKKYNKSLKETAEAVEISAKAGLKQVDALKESSKKVTELVSRYKVLKEEAKENTDKQIELEKVVRKIGKAIPGAIIEVDKYGDALDINGEKTEEYIKHQQELADLITEDKLKETTSELDKQKKALEQFNIINEEGNSVLILGLGVIEKQGDAFFKLTTEISKTDKVTIVSTELKGKDLIAYKERQVEIENTIATLSALKAELDGTAEAQRKETEAKEKVLLINQLLEADSSLKRIDLEKMSVKELTKAYKKLIDSLNNTTTAKAGTVNAIKDTISKLKSQRDSLATTTKAYKSYEEAIQKASNALFELQNGKLIKATPIPTGKKSKAGAVSKATSGEGLKGKSGKNFDEDNAIPEIIIPEKTVDVVDVEAEEIKEQQEQQILDAARATFDALVDLGNQLFDAKIANIDAELQANEDKFARLIEMEEGNDSLQRKLAAQREKEREKLEKKKKKEQKKQAIFNKAAALINIGINTAIGISQALASGPPPLSIVLASVVGALGLVQTATVAATPIPKFAEGKGQFNDYEGVAIWGEKRREAKISKDGSIELSPNRIGNHLTHVNKDDIIHPDANKLMSTLTNEELYNNVHKHSIAATMSGHSDSVVNYIIAKGIEKSIDAQTNKLVRELQNNKPRVKINQNINLGDEFNFLNAYKDTL